jgi:protein CpxP
MHQLFDRSGRALATTALLGILTLAAPTRAQTPSPSDTTSPAPMATPSTAPTHKTPAKAAAKQMTPEQRVEAHIADLHRKLKITSDEEPKWTEVAQVMRDNAQKIDALLQQRRDNLGGMSAVDDLNSYRDVTQAHLDGLQKLITAFSGLYDTMPPDQKKTADMVFAQAQGSHHRGAVHTTSAKKS